jgi:hypothetical protein
MEFSFLLFLEIILRKQNPAAFLMIGNFADLQLRHFGTGHQYTVSFFTNYIGKGEYKNTTLNQLMGQPYGRVVILHVTIIIGGFLVALFGSPVVGLIMLIALKTFIDIKTHLKQHTIFDTEQSETVEVVGSE